MCWKNCTLVVNSYKTLTPSPSCRSCYMVFPSLQLALALSCVMGLVMFARYCGGNHSDKLDAAPRDAVSCFFLTITNINLEFI